MNRYLTMEQLLNFKTPEQRSPEWFAMRSNYSTSSDLGTVLGLNKYKTAEELFNEKTGIVKKEFIDNEAIKHGVKYEAEAIDLYCTVLNRKSYEIGLVPFNTFRTQEDIDSMMDCSFLAGSVDGVTVANETGNINIIEVKCPLYRRIKYGVIPDYYYPQVQMNIHILNVPFGDYIEYVPVNTQGNKTPLLNIVRVYRDDEWLKAMHPTLKRFWNDVLIKRNESNDHA